MSINDVMFWLLDPLRAGTTQAIGESDRLHGLLMTLAAGVLVPLAVLLARYFKVLPGQDWPRQLNRRTWWAAHLGLAYASLVVVVVAVYIVLKGMYLTQDDDAGVSHLANPHGWFGWLALLLLFAVILNGWQRGSTGGPGKPAPGTLGPLHGVAGDHYDMTARRRWFERTHKMLGYLLLGLLFVALISGLWHVNASRGLLLGLGAWWVALLLAAWRYERQGRCIDGYQAIWGPSMAHPGNRIPALGWGSRRYTEEDFSRLSWARRTGREKTPAPVTGNAAAGDAAAGDAAAGDAAAGTGPAQAGEDRAAGPGAADAEKPGRTV